MPGSSYGEKYDGAGIEVQTADEAQLASHSKVGGHHAKRKDQTDETLGKCIEGHDDGERQADESKTTVVNGGFIEEAERLQEQMDGDRHPKGKQHIRDKQSGKQIRADGCGGNQR